MGAGSICPRPQMEEVLSACESSSSRPSSPSLNSPFVQPVSMSTIFCEPTRQGTHFPQDSLRKNFTELSAMSNMHVPSAQTTMAAEPTIDPAFETVLKSNGRSSLSGGKYPDDGPDGANPTTLRSPVGPPAYS